MRQRILFGTSSWGLGHATRDLVLLRALLQKGHRVTIVATGPALRVLQGELGNACDYLDWPDMPSTIAHTTAGFYAKTVSFIPRILWMWFAEKRRLRRLLRAEPYDIVITDHRYGMVTGEAPCYFITHSPRYIAPWRSWFMETCMEWFVARWLTPVRKVLVPDDQQIQLSGDMSHAARFLPPEKLAFMGILSSVQRDAQPEDVDIFISVSGPEPQRTRLQEKVLDQVGQLEGRIVVALGQPGGSVPRQIEGIEIHPYLDRKAQQEMMNRSRLVVCRSGYTTLMELGELGKKALLIPTPGQTEQLYLGRTLRQRGCFHSVYQHELNLARDIPRAREYPGFRPGHLSDVSADRFLAFIADSGAAPTASRAAAKKMQPKATP